MSRTLPTVKKHSNNAPFILAFLKCLTDSGQQGKIDREVASNVIDDLLFNIASDFKLCQFIEDSKTGSPRWCCLGPNGVHKPYEVQGDDLLLLVKYGIQNKAFVPVRLLLASITASASAFSVVSVQGTLIPFLQKLPSLLEQNPSPSSEGSKADLSRDRFCDLYCEVLCSYLCQYVGPQPRPPPDWRQRPVTCLGFKFGIKDCTICLELNRFLSQPYHQCWFVKQHAGYRKHLEQQLRRSTGCIFHTETQSLPYTLVITKTLTEHESNVKKWDKRLTAVMSELEVIGVDNLKMFIGQDISQPLRTCRFVMNSLLAGTPLSSISTNSNVRANDYRGHNSKRARIDNPGTEVIDLT